MAVFDVNPSEGLTLVEKHSDVSVEDIVKSTKCDFKVCVIDSTNDANLF